MIREGEEEGESDWSLCIGTGDWKTLEARHGTALGC